MIRILLASVLLLTSTSAMAKKFEGRNNRGDACTITLEVSGGTTKIGLRDRNGSTGLMTANSRIVSSDGRVVTYAVINKNRVLMDVAVFANGFVSATKYPVKNGYCNVRN